MHQRLQLFFRMFYPISQIRVVVLFINVLQLEDFIWRFFFFFLARPKVAINKKRYIVTPIDKRILLRTGGSINRPLSCSMARFSFPALVTQNLSGIMDTDGIVWGINALKLRALISFSNAGIRVITSHHAVCIDTCVAQHTFR